MGWVFRHIDQHKCVLPSVLDPDIWPKDMWQCDHCDKYWEVREDTRGEKYFHRHGRGLQVGVPVPGGLEP